MQGHATEILREEIGTGTGPAQASRHSFRSLNKWATGAGCCNHMGDHGVLWEGFEDQVNYLYD